MAALTGAEVIERLSAAGRSLNVKCQALAAAMVGEEDAAQHISDVLHGRQKKWRQVREPEAEPLRAATVGAWAELCVDVRKYARALGHTASRKAAAEYESYLFNVVLSQIQLEKTWLPRTLTRPGCSAIVSARDVAALRRDGFVVLRAGASLFAAGVDIGGLRRDLALLHRHGVIARTNSTCNPGAHGTNLRCGTDEEKAAFVKQGTPSLLAAAECLRALPHELQARGYSQPGAEVLGVPGVVLASAYDGGAHYHRHLDCYGDDNARALTLILYANEPEWDTAADGGALRLEVPPSLHGAAPPLPHHHRHQRPHQHPAATAAARTVDIAPSGGTLVLFESRRVWHEVLPATGACRYAVTLWVHGGAAPSRTPPTPPTRATRATREREDEEAAARPAASDAGGLLELWVPLSSSPGAAAAAEWRFAQPE